MPNVSIQAVRGLGPGSGGGGEGTRGGDRASGEPPGRQEGRAWPVTVGVSVTCHHAPFDHTEVPFPPPKVPLPCPALVLPKLQVNCFQIGGALDPVSCVPRGPALKHTGLLAGAARSLNRPVGSHVAVGPSGPPRPAGSSSCHCCPDLPVPLAGPELVSRGDALAAQRHPVLSVHSLAVRPHLKPPSTPVLPVVVSTALPPACSDTASPADQPAASAG